MQETGAREGQAGSARSAAELPPEVGGGPIEVYVNGVRQWEGRDFRREGARLLFDRPLEREGRLGFWRWASIFLGIAGTYRRNDTVDVIHERDGRRLVLNGLPIRPLE